MAKMLMDYTVSHLKQYADDLLCLFVLILALTPYFLP